MADVELLPLPLTLRHPSDKDLADHVQTYARACVEANLAALQAEVERLREVLETCLETEERPKVIELARAAIAQQPAAVEGFDEWYDSVDARFWDNRDACNAAFHAGRRAALAQQSAAGDEAMVERFCRRWYEITGRSLERAHVLASLDSALAAQQQGGRADG